MKIDETKLVVEDVDDQLPKKNGKKSDTKMNFLEDQFKERSFLVKIIGGLALFVVAIFMVIFAVQLLRGTSVDDSLKVFKEMFGIGAPIITLVLGYYFGSNKK